MSNKNSNSNGDVKSNERTQWNFAALTSLPKRETRKSKSITSIDMRTGNPSPEDVTLTSGMLKKKKKSFEIFHWKFMVLSVLFVFGLCGTTIMWFTTIYHDKIFKTLTLGNGTKLHNAWKNPPLQPLLCVHIFNYTNYEEFFSEENRSSNKIKLKVQDTGPYCFREEIERTNIVFRGNETELTYNERRTHVYDEDASVGSLNDTVIVPNVLIISVYKAVENMSSFVRSILDVTGAKGMMKIKVQDYLFGYEDNIFSAIGSFSQLLSGGTKKLPKKFGILMKRTGLSNDTIAIRTGNGYLDEMGQVVEINNMTMFDAWSTDTCNAVTGSDGLFFVRSAVQSHNDVELFHKDSCRTLPLSYDSVVDVGSGISANRYKLRRDIFSNSKIDNECFCNVSKSCQKDGVLDISSCSAVQGAPIVLSRPHFLDSNANKDSEGEDIIQGFSPNISEHEFQIDIFPPIGLTVRTLMRMQMNIMISDPSGNSDLHPLPHKTIIPMVWVEMNSGEVPEKMFSLLFHLTYTMRWAELALKWMFLIFTLLMAFILCKNYFIKTSSKKEFVLISKKKKSNNVINSVYVSS